jgi:predicted RNase H-like HicB family nuclease
MERALYYIALLRKGMATGYSVNFPDFPGCVSAGSTVEETLRNGTDALALHVDEMRRNGDAIPTPRSLEKIQEDAEISIDGQGVIVATLPLLPPAGQSIRINVTIDKRILARIDSLALNRSEFLTSAARSMLESK